MLSDDSTAYVMCKTNLTHEDAFTFVQSRRFCVAPRIEFQHQLEVSLSSCLVFFSLLSPVPLHRDWRMMLENDELRNFAQAYETIFRAGQTIASDTSAHSGNRERRRGRQDSDDEDAEMGGNGMGGVV